MIRAMAARSQITEKTACRLLIFSARCVSPADVTTHCHCHASTANFLQRICRVVNCTVTLLRRIVRNYLPFACLRVYTRDVT